MSREKSSTSHFDYILLSCFSGRTRQVPQYRLKREIREELGAEVEVKEFFMHPFSFYYSEDEDGFEGCIKLFPMLCTLWVDSPDPSAREGVHDNLNWVTAVTLDQYDMLGADMLIVEKILLEHYDRCSSRSLWIRGDGRSV